MVPQALFDTVNGPLIGDVPFTVIVALPVFHNVIDCAPEFAPTTTSPKLSISGEIDPFATGVAFIPRKGIRKVVTSEASAIRLPLLTITAISAETSCRKRSFIIVCVRIS